MVKKNVCEKSSSPHDVTLPSGGDQERNILIRTWDFLAVSPDRQGQQKGKDNNAYIPGFSHFPKQK
jgi:hypothetical protein